MLQEAAGVRAVLEMTLEELVESVEEVMGVDKQVDHQELTEAHNKARAVAEAEALGVRAG